LYSHKGSHFLETTIPDNPCGTVGKFWWPSDDPDAKDMFALSLAALMSGKPVRVVYDETQLACVYGGAVASHMQIRN
jgi:hypothetical protein